MGNFLDELFTYKTLKFVKIRDKRLGALHWLLMLAIFAYVICYVIIWKLGFAKRETPVGAIAFTVEQYDYGTAPTLANLGYCRSSNLSRHSECQNKLPCLQWTQHEIIPAALEERALLLTSRVRINATSRTCPPDAYFGLPVDTNCTYSWPPSPLNLFVANIEEFLLVIFHSPQSPTLGFSNFNNLQGYLQKKIGPGDNDYENIVPIINQSPFPDDPAMLTGTDQLYVKELLAAASIDLDDIVDIGPQQYTDMGHCDMSNSEFRTRRFDGFILVLTVQYSNLNSFHDYVNNVFAFALRPTLLPKIRFYYEEPQWVSWPNNLTILERHGPRIVTVFTGQLGLFDFQTLMLQMTSSLGLLGISVFIIDLIALKVLKEKDIYEAQKFSNVVRVHRNDQSFAIVLNDQPKSVQGVELSQPLLENQPPQEVVDPASWPPLPIDNPPNMVSPFSRNQPVQGNGSRSYSVLQ